MKYKILIVLLYITYNITAQVAIINDKDGYTNVRKKPNSKSEIVYKLLENEMFQYETENEKSDWIKVYIRKNKFDINEEFKFSKSIEGYIHKTRLLTLSSLKMEEILFSFKSINKEFKTNENIIDYSERGIVNKINGRHPYGIDGTLPTRETIKIEVYVDGVIMPIPKVLFENLYQSNNNVEIGEHYGCYFAKQHNSDGAGGYQVYWAINHSGLQQRLIITTH